MWMIHKEDLLFEKKRKCRQQVIKRAAVDLTIEENVLKKILQENKIYVRHKKLCRGVSNLC